MGTHILPQTHRTVSGPLKEKGEETYKDDIGYFKF